MSVSGDIHAAQHRLFEQVGTYVQRGDVNTLQARRRTQLEVLDGKIQTLEEGANTLERVAEDLERRIAALE